MGTSKGMVAYTKHFKPYLNSNGEVASQIKPNTAQLEKYGDEVGVATLWQADNPNQIVSGLTLP